MGKKQKKKKKKKRERKKGECGLQELLEIAARNTTYPAYIKEVPSLGQKSHKTDYFQEFYFSKS